jgi:hypothetical protein
VLRQVGVGVQELGRLSPGHGSAPGLLALWKCGCRLRSECALLGVNGCAYGWRTPALAWSRQCPRATGVVGMWRSASRSMCVAWWVCVPMVGAHWYSPGHGQCPWAAGIVGMRRSASHRTCVAWCVGAYGRRTPALVWSRAVPLGRWHCWNAAVGFAQNVRCLVGVCAYGRRTPALALSRQCRWAAGILGMRRSASLSMCVAWCVCAYGRRTPALAWSRAVLLGRWHCWNAAVSFAQHVRCLVCFSLPAAALSSDPEAGDSVPWHRTYRYWSNPETGRHCLWSSLPSNKPAVAHKPVIACLSTGLIGGEASLRKGTAAPGPLFLQIVSMGGER